MTPLVSVRGLGISAPSADGMLRLVQDVTFDIAAGERIALVGESGSGKSVTARALLRLDNNLRLSGAVEFDGQDLLTLSEAKLAGIRGRSISMVFQNPLSSLNPTMTIGAQVAEPLIVHGVRRREAYRRAREVLDDLGIANAAARMRAFPHEFSGGMRQRVVMAMALVNEPSLLIADEPTTALDVRVQDQVLQLLHRVAQERSLAVLLITHDVGIVAGFADRVLVMYSGRTVESASIWDVFKSPAHPYTQGLLAAVPRFDHGGSRLVALPGSAPNPASRPAGCAFHPRCAVKVDRCRVERPDLLPLTSAPASDAENHLVACHVAIDAVRRGESVAAGALLPAGGEPA